MKHDHVGRTPGGTAASFWRIPEAFPLPVHPHPTQKGPAVTPRGLFFFWELRQRTKGSQSHLTFFPGSYFIFPETHTLLIAADGKGIWVQSLGTLVLSTEAGYTHSQRPQFHSSLHTQQKGIHMLIKRRELEHSLYYLQGQKLEITQCLPTVEQINTIQLRK